MYIKNFENFRLSFFRNMPLFSIIEKETLEQHTKRKYDTRGQYIVYYTVYFIARGIRKYGRHLSKYLGKSSIWFIVVRKVIYFTQRHPKIKKVLIQSLVKFSELVKLNQLAKKYSINNKNPDLLTQNIFDSLEDTIY